MANFAQDMDKFSKRALTRKDFRWLHQKLFLIRNWPVSVQKRLKTHSPTVLIEITLAFDQTVNVTGTPSTKVFRAAWQKHQPKQDIIDYIVAKGQREATPRKFRPLAIAKSKVLLIILFLVNCAKAAGKLLDFISRSMGLVCGRLPA